ncbi:MAG: hypothetical protein ACFFBD_14230 [Candidatus Hodarchaeota archaeon]
MKSTKIDEKSINNSPESVEFLLGNMELLVSDNSEDDAHRDVERLEVDNRSRNLILTGKDLLPPQDGHTESDVRIRRDFIIYSTLIKAGYNLKTFKTIFFNKFLGCSDRIIQEGEETLRQEINKAIKTEISRGNIHSHERKEISRIKNQSGLRWDEKLEMMSNFISANLFDEDQGAGSGFYNPERKLFYFFDKREKMLMDLESIDFYCFIRNRYGIQKKEYDEVRDAIMTRIWSSGERIEAHLCSYFDKKHNILYLSDFNNKIYKLDGENISYVDNGTDGVFFEFNTEYTPYYADLDNTEIPNYFKNGFDWNEFNREKSLLCKYLSSRANFYYEEHMKLSIDEQKYLLIIYFFSLFFESAQSEKPIACFVGRKASGKSFIATSIGKILFGERFQSRHCPDNLNDLRTVIGENYFLVFDNLDHWVKHDVMDTFCVAATGGTIEKRKLYTDHEVVKVRPRVFISITSREAKFKRDDLVSRMILFNTKKIDHPKSKTYLFNSIEEKRNEIFEEILVNLNSIVQLLKSQTDFSPECISRIADFELFGRKIAPGLDTDINFISIIEKMNASKDIFGIEDDQLFYLLNELINNQNYGFKDISAGDLYLKLQREAEILKMKDFTRKYKSPVSIGKWLHNHESELSRIFKFEIRIARANQRLYTITRLDGKFESKIEDQLERRKRNKQ